MPNQSGPADMTGHSDSLSGLETYMEAGYELVRGTTCRKALFTRLCYGRMKSPLALVAGG